MLPLVRLHIIILMGCLVLSSCSNKKEEAKTPMNTVKKEQLFSLLGQHVTGIDFVNRLEENTYMNSFFYEYYYNGSGVATADFNNDNFVDIYFVSTLSNNQLYLNKGDLKFQNISEVSKTQGSIGFSTGVTVVDINSDGLMDIYVCKSGSFKNENHLKNELFVNQGINEKGFPVFKENAKAYGLDLTHNSIQASFFDYDRDGDLDMFLINHGLNQSYNDQAIPELRQQKNTNAGEKLYINNNSKFVEVTQEAGIIGNALGYTLGIAIGDVNNDGWPDVYTGNDYAERDHLYLNNKNGTFTETALQSFGHVSNFSMGNDMADINNDGLIDIMALDMMAADNYTQKTSMSGMNAQKFWDYVDIELHYQYMYNTLQLNQGVDKKSGIPKFSDIAQLAGISRTDWSWSPLFFDMDNDGYKDLFVSNGIMRDIRNNDFNIYHKNKRQEIHKRGTLDKDAYINDLLTKMPSRKKQNYFFKNKQNLTFQKVDINTPMSSSNGSAYADFDNDGDIDLVVNNSNDVAGIYRNNSENENQFLTIKLEGTAKNTFAIGAKIEIITKNGKQILENYFTRGFQSAMSDLLHFGLGNEKVVDTLKIIWPNGKEQYQYNIASNQHLKISYKSKNADFIETKPLNTTLFEDITTEMHVNYSHQENDYNDFKEESLMPHKMSQSGPALAKADVNNNGLEDFYVGGAKGQSGVLYVQTNTGTFKRKSIASFTNGKFHEDTGALFLDADNDGDLDLYVVSGGNEEKPNSAYYTDRFYENDGKDNFIRNHKAIPYITTSGQKITAGDYDNDGDLDLFVGSRVLPMNYGKHSKSYILENQSTESNIKFNDVTEKVIPELLDYNMVTDALWEDMDGDKRLDLVVACEWGHIDVFKNTVNGFVNNSSSLGLDTQVGWWYAIEAQDIDNDGDLDLIAGNLGLNYKYKATNDKPFYMYINDFDDNESTDIVLGYHEDDNVFPLRGRECTSNQIPFIKKKFPTYDSFGKANLNQVYGDKLNSSIKYTATNFASCILINQDNKKFSFKPLPNEVQISSINQIRYHDFDKDGFSDLILFGNLYGSEVETPRNDASYGHFLKGLGDDGTFQVVSAQISGLMVNGDVKNTALIKLGKQNSEETGILIARNNDNLMLFIALPITDKSIRIK